MNVLFLSDLTSAQNVFSKDQDTATLGVIWWFGRKQGPGNEHGIQELNMQDLIFVAITIAFFALSLGYVHFCDRVK